MFDLNWEMSGSCCDDSCRYFLNLIGSDVLSQDIKEMKVIIKKAASKENELVAAKMCDKGSFFVGADVYYI